jgi:hypothetical protein
MRATVYIPIGVDAPNQRPKNWTDATSTDVEVETIEQLLNELTDKAPVLTRVVAHHNGTTHFQLTRKGWKCIQRVIV